MCGRQVLPEVYALLMQSHITAAADAALHEAEEQQEQGMRLAEQRLHEGKAQLQQEAAQATAEVRAGSHMVLATALEGRHAGAAV